MEENEERFLEFVRGSCKDSKIELILSPDRQVRIENIDCNGVFDSKIRKLVVATGQPLDAWFKVLAHEFSHMRQWIEGAKVWKDSELDGDAHYIMGEWLTGNIELSKKNIDKFINRARDLELDCEKRTLNWIRAFELPINEIDYIKRANAYVYFYTHMKGTRKWYKIGNEPYNIDSIVKAMPTHFDNDYDNPSEIVKQIYTGCLEG